jgi:hypothetical protein
VLIVVCELWGLPVELWHTDHVHCSDLRGIETTPKSSYPWTADCPWWSHRWTLPGCRIHLGPLAWCSAQTAMFHGLLMVGHGLNEYYLRIKHITWWLDHWACLPCSLWYTHIFWCSHSPIADSRWAIYVGNWQSSENWWVLDCVWSTHQLEIALQGP